MIDELVKEADIPQKNTQPYERGQMSKGGNAKNMLIVKHNFPHTYVEGKDKLATVFLDRIQEQHGTPFVDAVLKNHGLTEKDLDVDLRKKKAKNVIAFLEELLQIDEIGSWKGYRVLGTVGKSGNVYYRFDLFTRYSEAQGA